MTEYRNADGTTTRIETRDTYVEPRRSSFGRTILILLVVAALIAVALFATGFWKASVSGGNLPEVSVKGGDLPSVDVSSKEVVVGTKKTTVDVPKIETKKTTIDVPTVGVKDNK
jgi:hypothetical protein